jgi:2Fe-2S ferredoxin
VSVEFFPEQNMPKITYVSDAGDVAQVDVPVGYSVMEGAVRNGIDGIVAECGGNCQCATCHVYVEERFLPLLPARAEDEDVMLGSTASERRPNSRLSCQLRVTPEFDGLVVHTPPTQQ